MDKFVNRYKRLLKWFTQPNYDTNINTKLMS